MNPSRTCPNSGGLIFLPTVEETQAALAETQTRLANLEQGLSVIGQQVERIARLMEGKVAL